MSTVATPAARPRPTPAKPSESKPAESKPSESKPSESKPAESKPAESSSLLGVRASDLFALKDRATAAWTGARDSVVASAAGVGVSAKSLIAQNPGALTSWFGGSAKPAAAPAAAPLGKHDLELSEKFDTDASGKATTKGKNQEVAMAANVFDRLKSSGHLPKDAKMSDKLPKPYEYTDPATGEKKKATTYEAALVAMTRDKDKDGRLDLSTEDLAKSGILSKPATADELTKTLRGEYSGVSDEFLKKQTGDKSNLVQDSERAYGKITGKGRDVQNQSKGQVLTSEADRTNDELRAGAADRLAKGEDPKKLASEALARADQDKGSESSARMLRDTGDALMKAGHHGEARKLFERLKSDDYKDTKLDLLQERETGMRREVEQEIERHKKATGKTHASYQYEETNPVSGAVTKWSPGAFETKASDVADLKLKQSETLEKMEKTLGRKVDPHNLDDVRAYVQKRSDQGATTAELKKEYGDLMAAHYKHPGVGVDWGKKVPLDDRPGKMNEILKSQFSDEAGRKVVDCEAFSYMTDSVFSGIKGKDGKPRFEVEYATGPGHIVAGVKERKTGEGWIQNNEQVQPYDPADPRGSYERAHHSPDLKIGPRPSDVQSF